MITRCPPRVRMDSRVSSNQPARTDNPRPLIEWYRIPLVQRQEITSPRHTIDIAPSLPSVVSLQLSSFSPSTTTPSLLPVLTSLTHTPSPSNKPDPTFSNTSIPSEATVVFPSNTLPSESTSFCGDPTSKIQISMQYYTGAHPFPRIHRCI